ncbi:MAG: ChbG/HpnK family deacetylase [Gammaproteobacteria bacterium]
MKKIILCADDYGQNESISQAIIALLEKNRLSATSCLTTSAFWRAHSAKLKPFINQVDIGLHFNLTEGKPLSDALKKAHSFMSLSKLLVRAYWRLLNAKAIEAELNAQLDEFELALGRLPDFIDGHQHVHQLPVIRQVVLKVYEQRLRQAGSYVRCVHDPKVFFRVKNRNYIKSMIIQLLGAATFKKELVKRKIPHNSSFSGIYQFAHSIHYSRIFPQFLANSAPMGIIMCHPGVVGEHANDAIAEARLLEFRYFESQQFEWDLRQADVRIGRFR